MVIWRDRTRIGRDAPVVLSMLLGAWLFVSAFLWPHTHVQMTNTWIFGALVVIFAALATVAPRTHQLNALAAFWLFVSAWRLPSMSAATVWNNMLVAVTVFILSLVPAGPTVKGSRPSTPLDSSP